MEELTYSINRTAKALGVGRSTVYKLIKTGQIDAWPAAGLVDTEIGCFHLSEVHNAKKEVQPRVQA